MNYHRNRQRGVRSQRISRILPIFIWMVALLSLHMSMPSNIVPSLLFNVQAWVPMSRIHHGFPRAAGHSRENGPSRILFRRFSYAPTSLFVTTSYISRFSNETWTAWSVAQTEALQADSVDALTQAWMLLGICQSPSPRILPTVTQYDLQGTKLQSILLPNTNQASIPKLSDFASSSSQTTTAELPISMGLQTSFLRAADIASQMGSLEDQIQPEHVLLALLEYREEAAEEAAAANEKADDASLLGDNDAVTLLRKLNPSISSQEICHSLLQSLMEQNMEKKEQSTVVTSTTTPSGEKIQTKKKEPVLSGSNASGGASDAKAKALALLQESAIDLTQMAREGRLDWVHGRDAEVQACFQTLVRRRKNNVCLIGEAGVGKTCIVEGLAQILVSKECPSFLEGHRIVSLEVGALLAGTKFRGEFEERLRTIMEVLTNSKTKSILFLDEIHNLVGAGGNGGGNMDASNILKPYLARGQVQVIGATTITEYNRYIAKDAALERRFQPVLIREPSVNDTVGILEAIIPFYQNHHNVEYTPASLQAAARLSDRYINDRFLPDKAIDLLDEAGALANLQKRSRKDSTVVTETSVTDVISQWTNIPVGKLEVDEMDRLQALESNLESRVKGQERAVRRVAQAIRRARTGIRNPRRPVASFLFCGPTGTGKTELCKALADTYFGSERRDLVRLDMSEFMEKSAVSRLTGPPPGLVGYEEGGQLTEAVRRAPHSVVLLDELEKAHGDVLNLLLQVLEDGILTDGKGRTISFKNTVLIMTSNIGSKRILDAVKNQNGSTHRTNGDSNLSYSTLSRLVHRELEKAMKPEFLNRIDDIIVFQPLSSNELSRIAVMMVREISDRAMKEKGVKVNVSRELVDRMVEEGSGASSDRFGARPMRRTIQRILEDSLSDAIVQGFLVEGDTAIFHFEDDDGSSVNGTAGNPSETLTVTVKRFRDDKVLRIVIEDLDSRDFSSDDVALIDEEYGDDSNGEVSTQMEAPPL